MSICGHGQRVRRWGWQRTTAVFRMPCKLDDGSCESCESAVSGILYFCSKEFVLLSPSSHPRFLPSGASFLRPFSRQAGASPSCLYRSDPL